MEGIHIFQGFLVVEDPEGTMKAYRDPTYYKDGIYSYEVTGPLISIGNDIHRLIEDASDHGDFTIEIYESMR